MPFGNPLGYIRAGLSAAASRSAMGSIRLGIGSGWRHVAISPLLNVGRGLSRMASMSNVGLSATMGGLAGGAYGAFSDNTSVLGGALMGAGLAGGGVGFASRFRGARALGMGVGKSSYMAAAAMGISSGRLIGRTARKGYNSFRAGFAAGRRA